LDMPDRVGADVKGKYEMDETNVLREGSHSIVNKGRKKKTGNMFEIKAIDKSKVCEKLLSTTIVFNNFIRHENHIFLVDLFQLKHLKSILREITILKEVNHPNIIKLHEVFEDDHTLRLVMELCTGEELFDRVVEKTQSMEGYFPSSMRPRL